MSAGAFEDGKYESNDGDIYFCRPQPESKALILGGVTNAYPAGDTDQKVSARLTGSKRQVGATARTVRVQLTATLAGYKANAVLTIPVFTPAVYDGFVRGQTGTYLGTAVKYVGRSSEGIV
jgi:hypothetical protein